ncbi:hypothetical protein EVAR_71085_1, partial [Eumeta japonica]
MDSPSLERKSEKSNSTISSNSITATNCCSTHLPQLTKFTSSFHIPANQDKTNGLHNINNSRIAATTNPDDQGVNVSALEQYKISKAQSAANLEFLKRKKDAENKMEKCFNDKVKKSEQKPLSSNTSFATVTLTHSTAAVNTASNSSTVMSSVMKTNNAKQEPTNTEINTTSSNTQYTSAAIKSSVEELNAQSQPMTLTSGNINRNISSQIPVPIANGTQLTTKKNYAIGKSNSTSQIPMASFQKPQIMPTITQQHVDSNMTTNHAQQHKKPFLNWTSFACNTNDPNYIQPKLQQSASVNNVAKKLQHFQPVQQHNTITTFKPDYLQKNPNKENKFQQQQQHHQPQMYNKYQVQQQHQPSAFVYHSQTKNPLSHSLSFSAVQKPLALQMGKPDLGEQPGRPQYVTNNFSNMMQQHHNRQALNQN